MVAIVHWIDVFQFNQHVGIVDRAPLTSLDVVILRDSFASFMYKAHAFFPKDIMLILDNSGDSDQVKAICQSLAQVFEANLEVKIDVENLRDIRKLESEVHCMDEEV